MKGKDSFAMRRKPIHRHDWQEQKSQPVSGYTSYICTVCQSECQKCHIWERGLIYHRYIRFRTYATTMFFF